MKGWKGWERGKAEQGNEGVRVRKETGPIKGTREGRKGRREGRELDIP
jgi:hypothetical protein